MYPRILEFCNRYQNFVIILFVPLYCNLFCLLCHKNHHTATRNYVLLFAFLNVSQPQNITSEFCLRILQFCHCTTCLAATWNSVLLFVHVLYCIV